MNECATNRRGVATNQARRIETERSASWNLAAEGRTPAAGKPLIGVPIRYRPVLAAQSVTLESRAQCDIDWHCGTPPELAYRFAATAITERHAIPLNTDAVRRCVEPASGLTLSRLTAPAP